MLSGSNLATALQVLLILIISVTTIQYMLGSWLMWSSVKKFAYQKVQGVVWDADELPPQLINSSNADFSDYYSNPSLNKSEIECCNFLKLLNKSVASSGKEEKILSRVKRTDDMPIIERSTENLTLEEAASIPSPSPLQSPLPSSVQSFSSPPVPSLLSSDSTNEKLNLSAKTTGEDELNFVLSENPE